MPVLRLLAAAALVAACGPIRHVPTEPRLLLADGRASAGAEAAAGAGGGRLRLAVYGDSRGNRDIHRAVVAAMVADRPDVVIFTGDALECFPAGHLPDYAGWSLLIPLWPQYHRGYPAASLLSLVPFPALLHETVGAPFAHVRDSDGFNAFLEDTAPLRDAGIPLLFAPGNHDLYHRWDRAEVARLFAQGDGAGRGAERLWFSADVSGWRLVILDTGTDLLGDVDPMPAGGAQLQWLEEILADAERRGLRSIVTLHLPPFSSAREDGSVPWVRERVVRGVLDRHRVELVLNGHAHAYERLEEPGLEGRPVTYVVTGGGGSSFFHVAEEREPGSLLFVEGVPHFVRLDLGPDGIRGEMIPVSVGGAPVPARDVFEVRSAASGERSPTAR
ncbi:MAG TPA: metallophosphoesterase [Anaeromyxobacteraceae bacterium]|nr:metallophosphoesterase [Anaeromyxobacteraceae bacterium]